MRLATGAHLTYCTNIHPGETWPEVYANLERYVLAVRDRIAPQSSASGSGRRFGLGLRLSSQAAEALADPAELSRFEDFLSKNELYVFTINGFPYGVFHGARVKEEVYLPDWLDDERLVYTDRLAWLLARLLPAEPGLEGSVSTVPGAFKARAVSDSAAADMAERMRRHAVTLHRIREETGKSISLALEPEPCCFLETIAETVAFFEHHVFQRDVIDRLCRDTGLGRGDGEAFLRHHVGVCFDTCHMAVEFEEPASALASLRAAGIRVCKVQISAGLQVDAPDDPAVRSALIPFAEGVYLHQVVETMGGPPGQAGLPPQTPQQRADGLVRYVDLPDALATAASALNGERRWRIHFHVPIFREQLGPFRSTQLDLRQLLAEIRRASPSSHLEIETYTWDVLPEELRSGGIVASVAREIEWVLGELLGPAQGAP